MLTDGDVEREAGDCLLETSGRKDSVDIDTVRGFILSKWE